MKVEEIFREFFREDAERERLIEEKEKLMEDRYNFLVKSVVDMNERLGILEAKGKG